MRRGALLSVLVVAPVLLAGCAGAQNCNTTETYNCQFGGSGQIDRSDTWDNPGSRAEVRVQMGGTGDITVTVADAAGQQVFSESYSGSGGQQQTSTTQSGQPGDWTVRIRGTYAGGLQVTVQSA